MDEAKRAIVEWWLRKVLLPFLGIHFPEFLDEVFKTLFHNERDLKLLRLRYIVRLGWKQISGELGVELRQTMELHKKCIYVLTLPKNQ